MALSYPSDAEVYGCADRCQPRSASRWCLNPGADYDVSAKSGLLGAEHSILKAGRRSVFNRLHYLTLQLTLLELIYC